MSGVVVIVQYDQNCIKSSSVFKLLVLPKIKPIVVQMQPPRSKSMGID
jgi:hypothetical protein